MLCQFKVAVCASFGEIVFLANFNWQTILHILTTFHVQKFNHVKIKRTKYTLILKFPARNKKVIITTYKFLQKQKFKKLADFDILTIIKNDDIL